MVTPETTGTGRRATVRGDEARRGLRQLGAGACCTTPTRSWPRCSRDTWRAGLDHFSGEHLPTDHPLVSMNNVVLTPHIGGATYDIEANQAS